MSANMCAHVSLRMSTHRWLTITNESSTLVEKVALLQVCTHADACANAHAYTHAYTTPTNTPTHVSLAQVGLCMIPLLMLVMDASVLKLRLGPQAET